MKNDDLNLPKVAPDAVHGIVLFPLGARAGKIRDVAHKLASKTTDRHAECYISQVTQALCAQMTKVGISALHQEQQISAFWQKVRNEKTKIHFQNANNQNPKGAA
jgi:Family of unknown function (DUF6074)